MQSIFMPTEESNESKKHELKVKLTDQQILMYFHSALRNVGLFTSISIAMLGYSRFYREKSKLYNVAFIIISLLFLSFSLVLNCAVIKSIEEFDKHNKHGKNPIRIMGLDNLPYYIFATNLVVILFGAYTLFREISK